jgi:TRAP-type C4-dicarboxylate transport system permease small subunit
MPSEAEAALRSRVKPDDADVEQFAPLPDDGVVHALKRAEQSLCPPTLLSASRSFALVIVTLAAVGQYVATEQLDALTQLTIPVLACSAPSVNASTFSRESCLHPLIGACDSASGLSAMTSKPYSLVYRQQAHLIMFTLGVVGFSLLMLLLVGVMQFYLLRRAQLAKLLLPYYVFLAHEPAFTNPCSSCGKLRCNFLTLSLVLGAVAMTAYYTWKVMSIDALLVQTSAAAVSFAGTTLYALNRNCTFADSGVNLPVVVLLDIDFARMPVEASKFYTQPLLVGFVLFALIFLPKLYNIYSQDDDVFSCLAFSLLVHCTDEQCLLPANEHMHSMASPGRGIAPGRSLLHLGRAPQSPSTGEWHFKPSRFTGVHECEIEPALVDLLSKDEARRTCGCRFARRQFWPWYAREDDVAELLLRVAWSAAQNGGDIDTFAQTLQLAQMATGRKEAVLERRARKALIRGQEPTGHRKLMCGFRPTIQTTTGDVAGGSTVAKIKSNRTDFELGSLSEALVQ